MVASSDPLDIGIASIIKKHERSYQEECLDLSIIERIQLSRMPDRRKSKALNCQLVARYTHLWSDAFEIIDLKASVPDDQFRSVVIKLEQSTLNPSVTEPINTGAVISARTLKDVNENSEPPPIETLKSFSTISLSSDKKKPR
jgi:hypothetical protein